MQVTSDEESVREAEEVAAIEAAIIDEEDLFLDAQAAQLSPVSRDLDPPLMPFTEITSIVGMEDTRGRLRTVINLDENGMLTTRGNSSPRNTTNDSSLVGSNPIRGFIDNTNTSNNGANIRRKDFNNRAPPNVSTATGFDSWGFRKVNFSSVGDAYKSPNNISK